MKIDRLIGIITILLQRDKITAPELAERFEVSRRTINRDIEDICKAGIPVITTQGNGGGISIIDNYKIDKSLLTSEELQAIFTGLKSIDSVSKTSYMKKLFEKLSNQDNHTVAEDIIIIDLASHYQESLKHKIEIIKNAAQEKKMISFHYYYEKGEGIRRIEPYRLVFKWSSWYVFGYCLDRNAYRLFKLNRLWNLQVLKDIFLPRDIPESELQFDNYFSSNNIHLKAIFAESEKHRLIEEYGIDSFSMMDSGELMLERDFASYENMRSWIFSFGDKVKILEPTVLRDDRKKQAENIIREGNRT